MSINRRHFLRLVGFTGAALATGSAFGNPVEATGEIEFHGMLYDSSLCVGCQECERACAKAHNLPEPKDEPKVGLIRKTSETQRSAINIFKTSKGEVFNKTQCMHCNEPACAAACLTQAMYKTKEGPVIWRGDKCMGCRYCMVSCPFDVPKFEYHSANPVIQKCDMCYEKVVKGGKPACVEACPAEAVIFGTRRELIAEARKRIASKPKDYYSEIFGENVAGGTGNLYISTVDFGEVGFKTNLQNASYPALSKGFLYTVPSVFVLLPPLLLGIHEATKDKTKNTEENEQ